MGVQKLETLPREAVPLTRHSDIKLVLDTPKGKFFLFSIFLCYICDTTKKEGERPRQKRDEEGRERKRKKEEERGRKNGTQKWYITEVHPYFLFSGSRDLLISAF